MENDGPHQLDFNICHISDVKAALKNIYDLEPDQIVCVTTKDKECTLYCTEIDDRFHLVGMLEQMKLELLNVSLER